MFRIISDENDEAFVYNKAVEECVEFLEVLIKLKTKDENHRPDKIELIKEYGDLVFRGFAALLKTFPEHSQKELKSLVTARINKKLDTLDGYYEEKLYLGGL